MACVVVTLKSVGCIEVVSAIVVVVTGGAVVILGQPHGTFGMHRFRVLVPGLRVFVPVLRVVLVSVRVPVVAVLSLPVLVSVFVLFVFVLVPVPRVRLGLLPLVHVPSVGLSAIDGQVHIGCDGHVLGGGQVGSRMSVSFVDCALAEPTKHSNTIGNSKMMLVFMIIIL